MTAPSSSTSPTSPSESYAGERATLTAPADVNNLWFYAAGGKALNLDLSGGFYGVKFEQGGGTGRRLQDHRDRLLRHQGRPRGRPRHHQSDRDRPHRLGRHRRRQRRLPDGPRLLHPRHRERRPAHQGRRHRRRHRAEPGRELRGHGHHDRAIDRRRVLRPVPEPRLLRDHPADRAEQHRHGDGLRRHRHLRRPAAAGLQQHARRHGPGRPGVDLPDDDQRRR